MQESPSSGFDFLLSVPWYNVCRHVERTAPRVRVAQNLHGKTREPGIQTLAGSPGMETYLPMEKLKKRYG